MVGAHEQRLEVFGKLLQQSFVLVLLKKSLPHVVLIEPHNRRLPLHQWRVFPRAELESAADDGQLPIDGNGSVRRTGDAAAGDIRPHLRLAEPRCQQAAQHGRDVLLSAGPVSNVAPNEQSGR